MDCSGSRLRLLYRRLSTVDCCCRFSGSRLNDFGSVRLCARRSWSRAEVTIVVRRFLVRVHSRVRWLCCGRCNPSRLLGWVPFLVRVNEWRFAAYSHRSAFFHLPKPGQTRLLPPTSGQGPIPISSRSGRGAWSENDVWHGVIFFRVTDNQLVGEEVFVYVLIMIAIERAHSVRC